MNVQLSMLEDRAGRTSPDDVKTEVRLGKHAAMIPRQKKRRIALKRLYEILQELEGKTIYIGSYEAGGRHFWINDLKLERLGLEFHPADYKPDPEYIPGVVVLWGRRGGCVRIFTDYLDHLREQEYQGYRHYLLDFRNGFYEAPLDGYRSHYACLQITVFKD